PAASPPPVSAPDPAAPAAEPPEAAGEPSPTAGEPAEATGSLDPALKRFSHLTLTLTASVGTATLTVRDWLNVGIGSRILLTSLRHQRVTIKLNGVPVGVGRVVLVNNTLGVEVEAWGARPGP
ncbi:MAG: FliM/FliN family flagellar motor switch protein, partial [Firmicutes bacterium]|nr:FliM/FliN family flagellar motor switch protein [Alicyclobacillaceae bacterium]MCL6496307.1 FliM/FliN family flagellar motor switch protein [Bacillota bacterium]